MANSSNNQDTTVTKPTTISGGGHLSLSSEPGLGGFIDVAKLVEENPVVLFGRRSCAMRIVAEKLLLNLATNVVLVSFDEKDEAFTGDQLIAKVHGVANGAKLQFPVVFVAGRLLGGVEEMISSHVAGALMPMLKESNALWL